MTGLTPHKMFMIVDDPAEANAFATKVSLIERSGNTLSYDGQDMTLPQLDFQLGKLIAADALGDWQPVLNWFVQIIDKTGYLVFQHGDPLREIGLYVLAQNGIHFATAFTTTPERIFPKDYQILGSSAFLMFASDDIEQALRKLYVSHYLTAPQSQPSAPVPVTGDGPRILLISYFFGASRTVGVQRTNYWHDQIPKLYPGATVVTATSIPGSYPDGRVIVLPDLGAATLLEENGEPVPWAAAFIETEGRNAKSFTTLSYYWRIALERNFDRTPDHFDVVIISGNPFAVFDFAAYAKRTWFSRVILDYRDPFGNNPRIQYKPRAREAARYVERGYNFQADLVTVVNHACADMVEADPDLSVQVIPNGFDDRAVAAPLPRLRKKDGLTHFVHVGSFYAANSPVPLINALESAAHRLHHAGNSTGAFTSDLQADPVVLHGFKPYDAVLGLISQADCGVVFASESGFDTPTKMYDYLAHGLDILIVTHGPHHQGATATVTDGLDGVYWVDNTPEAMADFLASYVPSPQRRVEAQRYPFSRRAGTETLIEKIKQLLA